MPTITQEQIDEKQAEIKEELLNNQDLWKHYGEYREESVRLLIDSYSLCKAELILEGNYTRNHHEYVLEEWTNRSWFALGEIQSKKLFDMQCRWRSGEIDELPGIKWTYDFRRLQIPILDYEAIPQVTESDIDHYIEFLKSPAGRAKVRYGLLYHQDHAQIVGAHVGGAGYMPEYYHYHYQLFGNTHLLTLPDIREKEENRLMDLAVNRNEETIAAAKKQDEAPVKQYLSYHTYEAKLELAEFLGEKQVATFIKDMAKWVKEKPSFETDWARNYLSRCYPDNVPMPAAPRWQDAIQDAALNHINQKVQEKLPGIYEEYLIKRHLGTSIGPVRGESPTRLHTLLRLLEIGERLDRGETVDPDEI